MPSRIAGTAFILQEEPMKMTKLLLVLLTLSLLLTGLMACSTEGGTDNPNAGACDMNEVEAEIDSMQVGSFTETKNKTDYVRFNVQGYGSFVVRLRPDVAPATVENFQGLVAKKYYDGITFHRVVKDFMIQGGDPDGNGTGGDTADGKKLKGEFAVAGVRNELSHITGVISMARRADDVDSATSQFFICNSNASYSLDGLYAGFGYVVAGLETVLLISDADVKLNAYGTEVSVPTEKIIIDSIVFVEKK
jgi:cyclophilin family peptidyl-prolyl cis-trans isomerase